MIEKHAFLAAEYIRAHCALQPKLGIILGSGLGDLAHQITQTVTLPYEEIPGFGSSTIAGHHNQLHLGYLEGYPVACCQGRVHLYEGDGLQEITTMIRTLKLLGCETLLLTNAAGSLRPDMPSGSLMCITDHINLQGCNPLAGENDARFGERFFNMTEAYDKNLRQLLIDTAATLNLPLFQGVYMAVLGPSFETPAEIRAFRILGADAIGMSTIPEVIVARHCGLKILALSAITNMAAGMSTEPLTHTHTLQIATRSTEQMTLLIAYWIRRLAIQRT